MTKEKTQSVEQAITSQIRAKHGKASAYISTLDGWRAIAILWVLEGHSRPWSIWGISNHWLVETGYRGVQLFFALSGFLICTRLLREENRFGLISLRSFYTRRVFRIQPAAMTYLLVVMILMLCGAIPTFWPGVAGAALMVRNIWPSKLSAGYWYTSHFWSLAVEEHFYLLLPGFLVLFRRYRLAILSGVAVALEIWRMIVLSTPRLQHALEWQVAQRTDVVLGGILLGSVFSVALTHQHLLRIATSWLRPWVALLYTAFVFVEVQRHHSALMQTALITAYPVLIVATALHPDSWSGRFLELAPVRFVGRISYSLYLWQQLFFHGEETPAPGSFQSHVFLCWCATVACAIASYYLIETPLVRRGHRIAKRFDLQQTNQPENRESRAMAATL
jgi:peptidoglycan/LPS O-acetylase OafA/YrhL